MPNIMLSIKALITIPTWKIAGSTSSCNCRNKTYYPLGEECPSKNVITKGEVVSTCLITRGYVRVLKYHLDIDVAHLRLMLTTHRNQSIDL